MINATANNNTAAHTFAEHAACSCGGAGEHRHRRERHGQASGAGPLRTRHGFNALTCTVRRDSELLAGTQLRASGICS